VTVLATLALAVPASSTAAKPATAAEMNTYLAKVRPVLAKDNAALAAANTALQAVDYSSTESMAGGAAGVVRAMRSIQAAAAALKQLRAAGDLAGPHANLARGIVMEANALGVLASALAAGAGLQAALDKFDDVATEATTLERDWRDEVTVELRRLRVPVPLWVKQVGV
jgi:hypothetical protein